MLAVVVLLIFLAVGLRLGRPGLLPFGQVVTGVSGYLQMALSAPWHWAQGAWRSYVALQEVRVESEALRLEVARLQQEVTQYREALIANTRLQRLLELKKELKEPVVAARVVAVDAAPWVATLVVDRGREDAIAPGMAVLAGAGIAGQVVESTSHFSRILLLSDYNSAADALVQRSRVRGVLKGAGQGLCGLSYVEKGADIQEGDEIVASGLDGIFPKGLLLGRVASVEAGPASDLFQEVAVRPAADLLHLEEVLVVLKSGSLTE